MYVCKQCHKCFEPSRKDAKYCSQTCGNNFRAAKFRKTTGQTQEFKDRINKNRSSPRERYLTQKHRAKNRGIKFVISFEDWWELWKPHWHLRKKAGMVMCRIGDSGAYEVGNVRIDTHGSNVREWQNIRRNQNG